MQPSKKSQAVEQLQGQSTGSLPTGPTKDSQTQNTLSRKQSRRAKRVKNSAPRRTRSLDANELTKGDPEDVRTFISVYDSEPKLGAYLGYTDVAKLREFALSYVVTEVYVVYHRHCQEARLSRTALELLRDVREKDEDFPAEFGEAVKKYATNIPLSKDRQKAKIQRGENSKNASYLLATLIYRLAHRINSIHDMHLEDSEVRQASATDNLFLHHSSAMRPPPFAVKSIVYPDLGPHTNLEEDVLEMYNRAYQLLRYLNHSLMPSRWNEKFAPGKEPFKSLGIHPSSLPHWMVPVPKDTAKSLRKARSAALPRKIIMLSWERNRKTKFSADLESHITEHIEYNALQLPKTSQPCTKDPRVFPTGEMWRDTVRRQLAFRELRVDFLTLHVESYLQPSDETPTRHLVYTTVGGEPSNWEDIKAFLLQTDMEATFVYTLKPFGEDEEFELEHRGPPLALLEDLRLDDGKDVELQPTFPDADTVHGGEESQYHEAEKDPLDEAYDDEQMAEVKAFLGGGGTTLDKKPPIPQSEFSEQNRAEMLAQHEGFDVLDPEGLETWQTYVLNRVCGTQPKLANEPAFRGNNKLTTVQKKELAAHRASGEQAALSTDPEQSPDLSRHYQVQAAFTGADTQVGPPVEPCKFVFGMRTVGKHGHHKVLDISTCDTLPGCDINFLDSQINAAAFMMQRSTGGIPVSPERAQDPEVAAAQIRLRSIRTYGGWLVDATGFGKTNTCLLFLSQWALYGDHKNGHKPTLIVVPNGAVFSQWCEAIWEHFRDLRLIISNDTKPAESKYLNSWISSTAMREAPTSLEKWPESLKYVFDPKDPRASRTVFVTPWDTHKDRTMVTEYITSSQKVGESRGKKKKRKKSYAEEEPVFTTRWKGFWGLLIADEAHRLRHIMTKTYESIAQLDIPVNWLPTATPVMNTLFDILGGLLIIWKSVSKALAENKEMMEWIMKSPVQGYKIFDSLQGLAHDDSVGQSHLIQRAKYLHIMDELVSIRRSTASVLQANDSGDTIDLKTMMPPHVVKTVELNYTAEEATEAQWFHRLFAREYTEALKGRLKREAELLKNNVRVGPDSRKEKNVSYAPTTGPLRRLALSTKSTKLARLDVRMRKIGYSTLVKDMESYRAKGHGVDWLIEMTKNDGDGPTNTKLEKLMFMAEGSSTLRYVLSQIRDYVLAAPTNGRPNKLVTLEETPLMAWFWELACNHLYISTKVMHSGLNNEERIKLVKEFNNPKTPLRILVLIYNVGSQGTNLDPCCHRVIVATAAISASVEVQGWGRVIRISQTEVVFVIRCKVLNSHDQLRDVRQQDKAIMDMATRSYTEPIKNLLVDLLNEANVEVREAYESAAGKQISADKAGSSSEESEDPMNAEHDGDFQLAKSIQESYDLEVQQELERSQQPRKQPQRLRDDREYLREAEMEVGANPTSEESESSQVEESDEEYDEEGLPFDPDEASSNNTDASSEFDPMARDDNPEAWRDEDVEVLLESRTRKQMRKTYNSLTRKKQEQWDQDEWNLRMLLSLSPDRIYTVQDLEIEEIHDRALRLLYRLRFGQSKDYARVSPHINYTHLHKDVCASIKAQNEIESEEVAYYIQFAKEGKATRGSQMNKPKDPPPQGEASKQGLQLRTTRSAHTQGEKSEEGLLRHKATNLKPQRTKQDKGTTAAEGNEFAASEKQPRLKRRLTNPHRQPSKRQVTKKNASKNSEQDVDDDDDEQSSWSGFEDEAQGKRSLGGRKGK